MSPTQLESQPAWQTCASLPIARDTPTNLFATTATPLLFLSRRRTNRRIGLQNKFIHSKTLAARRGIAQNASSSECSSPQSSFSFRFSPRSPSSSRSPPPSTASPIDPSSSSGSGIRRHPRIQVSSLLTFSQTRSYHLEVIQQPQRAAEHGMALLSRLSLTPPVIARLIVRDYAGNSITLENELPHLVAHLSLYSETGNLVSEAGFPIGQWGQAPPLLYGSLVSSINQLEDPQGNMGLFFIFPDVSIRDRGIFQLGISLLKLPSPIPSANPNTRVDQGAVLAQARTATFEVLPRDQYIASPQTQLTRWFISHGARMLAPPAPTSG